MKMTDIITNTGLNLPTNCNEEQFFECGKWLANIESGYQWALGDWYNSIEGSTNGRYTGDEGKKAACKRAGINVSTAAMYGTVAAAFSSSTRVEELSFEHHRKLAETPRASTRLIGDERQGLTQDERADLIEQALTPNENGKRMTAGEVAKARDKILGVPEKPKLAEDADATELVEHYGPNLKGEAKKITIRIVKKLVDKLRSESESQFSRAVANRVTEQIKLERASHKHLQEEARKTKAEYEKKLRGLGGVMSREEYRLVLGCLHPDRVADDQKPRYDRAFDIFKRLESQVE